MVKSYTGRRALRVLKVYLIHYCIRDMLFTQPYACGPSMETAAPYLHLCYGIKTLRKMLWISSCESEESSKEANDIVFEVTTGQRFIF